MKHRWLIVLVLTLSFSLAPAQSSIEDQLYAFVLSIENRTHAGRNEFIKEQLRAMNVGFIAAPFKKTITKNKEKITIEGENIITRIGNGKKRIVVGAHYDAFANSPGANDNGSGVAVLLSLLKELRDAEWNYTIDFCFFDQEEAGFLGSLAYVEQFIIPQRHLAMINLDIEGIGDEVYAGPMGSNNIKIMRYVNEAAKKTGFPFFPKNEFPASDHESFSKYNLQNISISIVPNGDADRLSKYVRNGYVADSTDAPKVLETMHTIDDRAKLVSPQSLKMSYEFTRTLLMLLNESGK